MKHENELAVGSLGALAQQSGASLAESFMSVDAILILDVSGSMHTTDCKGGSTSRYDAAVAELAALQRQLPGKLAVIGFSDTAQFCPGGLPFMQGGGTNMAGALRFIHMADSVPGMRFILISDGQPDNESETLVEARKFKNHIDTIFIGGEGGYQPGREFLQRLAAASGGQHATISTKNLLLEKTVKQILALGAGK